VIILIILIKVKVTTGPVAWGTAATTATARLVATLSKTSRTALLNHLRVQGLTHVSIQEVIHGRRQDTIGILLLCLLQCFQLSKGD
jgi:hypothetical protein